MRWIPNPLRVGTIGIIVTILVILAGLNYDALPLIGAHRIYGGHFADTGGLKVGDDVQVAGVTVGKVERVRIDGDAVRIDFSSTTPVGDRSELAIKTQSALGRMFLDVSVLGDRPLASSAVIPLSRTQSPYLLTSALGDLTVNTKDLDAEQLKAAMATLSDTMDSVAPSLGAVLTGVNRLSTTIGSRDDEIEKLLKSAAAMSDVLAKRNDQINGLILAGGQLFGALQSRRQAIDLLLTSVRSVSDQIKVLVDNNEDQLRPTLVEFERLVTLLEKHRGDITKSVKPLQQYATSLGESVASGPFFSAYVMNLLPGQFLQPFIDAAFEERGYDLSKLGQTTFPVPCGDNKPVPRNKDTCLRGFPRTDGG